MREFAQLLRRQQAVGNGHAQHRRMALDVEAVLQAQGTEVVLRQLAGEVSPCLVAELRDAFVNNALVYFVVLVHGFTES